MKSYASLLNGWLKRQGVSPGAAASRLGISESTAYEHAAGRSVPPASKVPALAAVLGVGEAKLLQLIARDRAALKAGRHNEDDADEPADATDAHGVRS